MDYRIYYANGETADNSIPTARGVQAIVQHRPGSGQEMVTAGDYYILGEDECWRPVDIFGLFDYLMDSGIVLFGRTIRQREYHDIVVTAMKDKETWRVGERKFV